MSKVPPGVMKSELYGLVGRSHTASGAELNEDINSPLEIANCELWLDASNGPMTAAYADPTNGQTVTTWQDASGNSRHATIAAGTPTMSTTGGYNGRPGVQIGANCRMETPAFVTAGYGNAITMFIVSQEAASLHSSLKIKASINTANFWVGNIGTTGARDITINGLTGFSGVSGVTPSVGGIDYVSVSASAVRITTDGFAALASSSASSDSTTITAGSVPFTNGKVTIGGLAGSATFDWPGAISEILVFSRALSTAELRRVYNYLSAKYGKRTLSLLGNSLISGSSSTGGPTQIPSASGTNIASRLMASSIATTLRIRNDAYPGRTGAQILSESPNFSGVWGDGSGSIALVWEGTNTLSTFNSVNNTFESLRRICLTRKQFGRTVLVGTVLLRGDTGNDAKNAAMAAKLNAMLRANYSQFADGIVDFAADSRLSDYNNATYFAADKTHLKDAGYQVAADLIVAAVSPLL